jgi:hypothetical protein
MASVALGDVNLWAILQLADLPGSRPRRRIDLIRVPVGRCGSGNSATVAWVNQRHRGTGLHHTTSISQQPTLSDGRFCRLAGWHVPIGDSIFEHAGVSTCITARTGMFGYVAMGINDDVYAMEGSCHATMCSHGYNTRK